MNILSLRDEHLNKAVILAKEDFYRRFVYLLNLQFAKNIPAFIIILYFNIIIIMSELQKDIHEFQEFTFNIIMIVSYILYGTFALGLSANSPQYLADLDYYVKIYISLFLLWRFNPFRTIRFNSLDRKIAFSSGVFLFATSALNQILKRYLVQIKAYIKSKFFN